MKKSIAILLYLPFFVNLFGGKSYETITTPIKIAEMLSLPTTDMNGGGYVPPKERKNLSSFDGFEIFDDLPVKLLDKSTSDTQIMRSNKNCDMGESYTDFEYYMSNLSANNTYTIIVLFKQTMSPYKNVSYKNGFNNMFTEVGYANSDYSICSLDISSVGSANFISSEPNSTIINYTNSVTISFTTISDPSGYSYYVPVFTNTITASYPSILVENKSIKSKNQFEIKHSYTADDTYSSNTSWNYGAFCFSIPSSSSSITLSINIESQFSVGKYGFWGASYGKAHSIHNKILAIK